MTPPINPSLDQPAPSAPDPPPIDLGPLPGLLGYAIRRAQIAAFQHFHRMLSPLDLRPTEFSVLLVMDRNPGLRQRQIGDALGIKPSNLTVLVDRLVQRGLLQRQPNPLDRRSVTLGLTEAGMALLAEAGVLVAEHERQLASRLSPAQHRQLLGLLRRMQPMA